MSAVFKSVEAELEPLTEERLEAVLAIEQTAYAHPWTRGNFQDSMRSGYQAQLLVADGELLGYVVAMKGVDEVHLLNITVAPAWQGQGWGRVLLDALAIWSRGQGAQWLWLEVRVSNLRALQIYERDGYNRVGTPKGHIPGGPRRPEEAHLICLRLGAWFWIHASARCSPKWASGFGRPCRTHGQSPSLCPRWARSLSRKWSVRLRSP